MAARYSTGLLAKMSDDSGIRSTMANGKIKIFSGPQPASADAAEQGTLLMELTLNAGEFTHGSPDNGINFDVPVGRTLSKAGDEVWRGLGLANGTAGWFRFVANPVDDGGASTVLPRIDGTVGVAGSGADMIVSTASVSVGQPMTADVFNLNWPA